MDGFPAMDIFEGAVNGFGVAVDGSALVVDEVVPSSVEVVATALEAETLMEVAVAFFFFCPLVGILRRRGAKFLCRSSSKARLTGVSVNIAVTLFLRPLVVAFRGPAFGKGRTATGLKGSSSSPSTGS